MKTILFDLETAPLIGATWGMWEQNVLWIEEDISLLCFAWKELGKSKITCPAVANYKKPRNDKSLVLELWKVLDDADIVVAHNASSFDVKMANSFFIKHKMLPPSPYEVVDTLTKARQIAKFTSNKLDSLGETFKIGRKVTHEGKGLWKKCLEGDEKAWKRMIKYCKQDVNLLEGVYLELLPWMKTHPNVSLYKQDEVCPKCGGNHVHKKHKRVYRQVFIYQRYRCADCGTWLQGERVLRDFKPKYK